MCIRDRYQRRVRGRKETPMISSAAQPNMASASIPSISSSACTAPSWPCVSALGTTHLFLSLVGFNDVGSDESWQMVHPEGSTPPPTPTSDSIARWIQMRDTPGYQFRRRSSLPTSCGSSSEDEEAVTEPEDQEHER
eukprot:TRINITY_DN393_c0_g1_i4.p1 TRINITY_DN393_c0_g1~~TRINITY_DN393_c0_g1_i4.p1  ORF type:complete len:137 (+),score=27.79 TRINITY_DN393_c0_g1_i4:182-592(+)